MALTVSYHAIVPKSAVTIAKEQFRFLEKLGSLFGCRLLCGSSRTTWNFGFRIVAFISIQCLYMLGIALHTLAVFPAPNERDKGVELNITTIFTLTSVCLATDGLACLITLNYANLVLSREGGFFKLYSDFLSHCKITSDTINRWKRFVITNTACVITIFILTSTLGTLYAFNVSPQVTTYAAKLERLSNWTSLSVFSLRVILIIVNVLSGAQFAYQLLLFSTMCESVRTLFRCYSQKLIAEPASSFSVRKIGAYQSDFGRLAELTEHLDDAFKHSCFCQLVLFVVAMCLNLFCFTRRGTNTVTIYALCHWLMLLILTFMYNVIPAILLRGEVSALTCTLHLSASDLLAF